MFPPFVLVQKGVRENLPPHLKLLKLTQIRSLLKPEFVGESPPLQSYDCLTPELRSQFNITAESGLSENVYHKPALQLIDRYPQGWILDFGAGQRSTYYSNVVNMDVMNYDTTDVIAVGERLPFKDNVFDVVHSNAVLEHVKDPFACAQEIIRVLKPGGELMCCVPFLQPFHACPHHYYNMTSEGLKNLFEGMNLRSVEVYEELRPITSLQLLIQDWANGLSDSTRRSFLEMRVGDLLGPYAQFRDHSIVTELSPERNFKMACCHTLFATKPSPVELPTLTIVKAIYGEITTPGLWVDVTDILRQKISHNTLTLSVHEPLSSWIPGDPAPGRAKELTIIWHRSALPHACSSGAPLQVVSSGTLSASEYRGYLRTPLIL